MRKKTLAVITVVILCLLAKAGFSQKKDSTVSYDTVYVFQRAEIESIKTLIMQSKMVGDDGQPLTGKQLIGILNYFDSKRTLIPKNRK
jgi:hypothetical protein